MTTALGIKSPWSGDEFDPCPRSYWWWFRLYVFTRKLRHLVNLHDDPPGLAIQCTWCGKVIR